MPPDASTEVFMKNFELPRRSFVSAKVMEISRQPNGENQTAANFAEKYAEVSSLPRNEFRWIRKALGLYLAIIGVTLLGSLFLCIVG
jgi:hypothetical protein